jgi:hypothetical protein
MYLGLEVSSDDSPIVRLHGLIDRRRSSRRSHRFSFHGADTNARYPIPNETSVGLQRIVADRLAAPWPFVDSNEERRQTNLPPHAGLYAVPLAVTRRTKVGDATERPADDCRASIT